MDPTQIVLLVSITLITATLVYIGYWIVNLLKELRTTITKTNSILDDTQVITSSISGPVASVSEFVMGFKNGMAVFNTFFPKDKTKASSSINEHK